MKKHIQLLSILIVIGALTGCKISGKITHNGGGLEGVEVRLSGDDFKTTLTDRDGHYSFNVGTRIANYTITPFKNDYTFAPQTLNADINAGTPEQGISGMDFEASPGLADWTIMVYLDADNNLEGAAIDDFLEMASAISGSNINVVVQLDRIAGFDNSYGNWTGCKRFRISEGILPSPGNEMESMGEINMGDPAALTSFINWATSNHHANNYALILWNHGGGWRSRADGAKPVPPYKAVCLDETDQDVLYTSEIKSALDAAEVDVTLIGFDACLMGMIEVAYELRNTGAQVMVGSEDVEPWDGWPYDTILLDLVDNPQWNAAELGAAIADHYCESYDNQGTQSVIDLTHMDDLADSVSDLSDMIVENWDSNEAAVRSAAQSVIDTLNETVIYEQHGTYHPNSHGLAIYFPLFQYQFSDDYNGEVIDFASHTTWDDFLRAYYDSLIGSWIEAARYDTQEFDLTTNIDLYHFCELLINPPEPLEPDIYEPDNSLQETENIIGVGDLQEHTFHFPGDQDYIQLDLTGVPPGTGVQIETYFLSKSVDTVLSLYDLNGGFITGNDDSDGYYSKIEWICDSPGMYVIRVVEYRNSVGDYSIDVQTSENM